MSPAVGPHGAQARRVLVHRRRLGGSVAAYERVGGPCVIVDFGTAITYDVVGEGGEYVGGIIAPGVEISTPGAMMPPRYSPSADTVS